MGGYIYEAHFECHDILMLGKSPIKWSQRPDMTITVGWDVKHQFNSIQKQKAYGTYLQAVGGVVVGIMWSCLVVESPGETTNLGHVTTTLPHAFMSRVMRKPDVCLCENKGAD